jgi:choline dehydrogenase-like flavoprotein
MEMNCVEKDVAARIKQNFGGKRVMTIGRVANITQPKPEQNRQCLYRDKCWLGCPFGGYFSTQSATLPAAMKTGNLTVRPFSIVKEVIYDKDSKKAKGVRIIDAQNNQTYDYFSRLFS